jgi:hypothetical protein
MAIPPVQAGSRFSILLTWTADHRPAHGRDAARLECPRNGSLIDDAGILNLTNDWPDVRRPLTGARALLAAAPSLPASATFGPPNFTPRAFAAFKASLVRWPVCAAIAHTPSADVFAAPIQRPVHLILIRCGSHCILWYFPRVSRPCPPRSRHFAGREGPACQNYASIFNGLWRG